MSPLLMRLAQTAGIAAIVGGLGAWAFNPEDGAIAHSDAAWQVFGIAFEVGLPLCLLAALAAAATSRRASADRRRRP